MVLSGISACRFSFQAKTMRKRLHVVFSMGTINTVNGWKYSANRRNCSSWNPFQGKHCMKNKPRAGSGKNAHWAAFLPEIVRAKTRAFTKISYTYTCNLQPAIGSAWLEKIDWKDLGLNFSVWRSSWADYPFQSESEQVLKRFLKTHTCMKPVLARRIVGEVRSEQIVRVTSLCTWDNE